MEELLSRDIGSGRPGLQRMQFSPVLVMMEAASVRCGKDFLKNFFTVRYEHTDETDSKSIMRKVLPDCFVNSGYL